MANNNNVDDKKGGYPRGPSAYKKYDERTLTHKDHFRNNTSEIQINHDGDVDKSFLVNDHNRHYTRDVTDANLKDIPTTYTDENGNVIPVFSGSTTSVNPTNDPDKQDIIDYGLENNEKSRINEIRKEDTDIVRRPPISPLHPFTRMNPATAQLSNLTTYNRTKLPVADLEFRKGFRHIFFTRPECYIMAHNPNGLYPILSEQAEHDEDFASCYSRMPHILSLLSPIYVTGSFSQNKINSNWNYLLSNRVMGLTTTSTSMGVNDNITKSIEGYTITPAMYVESRQGSTIELKFRDTKNMEIFEMMRMWMLYMYKRKKGIFSPPYNGYQYRNNFLHADESGTPLGNSIIYHPYDRALEYCASLFDIVTNESMTKILYWCKYYGVYPISLSCDGLSNDNNSALTSMNTTVNFKYHYKLENVNKTLVEFNYNAGITDDLGRVIKSVETSYPFLLRNDPTDTVMKQYIGSAGMFTGSPYIIMGKSQNDPLNNSNEILSPYLQFMPIDEGELNSQINLGITNVRKEDGGIIGIRSDDDVADNLKNTVSNIIAWGKSIFGSNGNSEGSHGGGGSNR
jgi:hypothetical protein